MRWLPFGPSYRIPRRLEASHIELIGDTGSGKSSAIRQILRQVQERGETAIVYDPAMEFVSEFYSPARGDLILNPLDSRCPYWGLGDELDRDETATTIAAAFLPEKEYEKEFFTDAPRRVPAHLLKRKPQPRDLLRWMSDPEQIAFMVRGTPLGSWLNQAEIEVSLLSRQCLGQRRIGDLPALCGEVRAWERRINRDRTTIDWKFTRKQARRKLHYSFTRARY